MAFSELVIKYAPWSVSKYGKLEKCLRQFDEAYLKRSERAESSPQARIGSTVHKVLEDCLEQGTKAHDELLAKYAPEFRLTHTEQQAARAFLPGVDSMMERLRRFEKARGVYFRAQEAELAIDAQFRNVAYDDKAVLIRGKIDYVAITEAKTAIVMDHKTGKKKPLQDHLLQLYTYAIFMIAKFPEVQAVQGCIHQVGDPELQWTPVLPRLEVEQRLFRWLETTLNRHSSRLATLVPGSAERVPAQPGWWCGWCEFLAGARPGDEGCPEGKAYQAERARRKAERDEANL